MEMFSQDPKNYHVWTYRHWLVRRFKLWDCPRELSDVEKLISEDVLNNSAWNHRFMLRFGPRGEHEWDAGMPGGEKGVGVVDEEVVDGELEFAKSAIVKMPGNRAPWGFARGVLRVSGRGIAEWRGFVGGFIVGNGGDGDGDGEEGVKSVHALEWLGDIEALEGKKGEAGRLYALLRDRYDPIRRNYWDYRIRSLG